MISALDRRVALLPPLMCLAGLLFIFWANYGLFHVYRLDLMNALASRRPISANEVPGRDRMNLLAAVVATVAAVPAAAWVIGRRSTLLVSGVRVPGELVEGRGFAGFRRAIVRYEFNGREYKRSASPPRDRTGRFENGEFLTIYLDPATPGRSLVVWRPFRPDDSGAAAES